MKILGSLMEWTQIILTKKMKNKHIIQTSSEILKKIKSD